MLLKITQLLSKLIAINTISTNSNLELIKQIKDLLDQQQLESRVIFNADKSKANLIATLPTATGSNHGGILFSGHTDTVPVAGQNWETDPFIATTIGNKIFGRGSADMKGFLAVILTLIPEFRKLNLPIPLHFAFSFDEELGCQGTPLLINAIQELGINPKLCIVGEPTEMQFIIAHKGFQSFRCLVQGLAAHSSLTPLGCNAIDYATKIAAYLRNYADTLQISGQKDTYYDVPFTTISTNVIRGGITHNTIPNQCELIFDFRNLPQEDPNTISANIATYVTQLQSEMRKQYPAATITLENLYTIPSFNSSLDVANESLFSTTSCKKVSYATEAGYFEQAGIKTIVCGPGNIQQAHQANEFIAIEQLEQCAAFLRKVVTSDL